MERLEARAADGTSITSTALLGEGGQGKVWRAQLGGVDVAVKVYHRAAATPAQREAILRLLDRRRPAPQFLWPTAFVEAEGTFGYAMPLRERRFASLEDFMARRVVPKFGALMEVGSQLADAFMHLHSVGLCYRDISFANVFFDPTTGDVAICDNDNVDISGGALGGVLGTPRFMAPEVVRREASPDAGTDRYSLAVLLFYLLYGGHPLDGRREAAIRCLDVPALERLYGTAPLYVWDPVDDSNAPLPGIHDNPIAFRDLYPKALSDLFLRSFTEGLRQPGRRVGESEWRKAFRAASAGLWRCGCKVEAFWDGPRTRPCWRCKSGHTVAAVLDVEGVGFALQPGRTVPRRLLERVGDDAVAEVVAHPADARRLGLKNLDAAPWSLVRADGTTAEIAPGRSAELIVGHRIQFPTCEGRMQAP